MVAWCFLGRIEGYGVVCVFDLSVLIDDSGGRRISTSGWLKLGVAVLVKALDG